MTTEQLKNFLVVANVLNFSPSYIAITLPDNHKSIMLLKKLGFEYEREQVDYRTNPQRGSR